MSREVSPMTDPATEAETPIFAARLVPHRSLSPQGVRWVLAGVATASALISLPFVLLGAWPVLGFAGLDVLIVYWAFRANFRSARAYEDVYLTPFELLVAQVSAIGRRAEWRFNPIWVRLERDDHEDFGTLELALVSRGRRLEIARCLGPEAKGSFAQELSRALTVARQGPRYS